MTVKKQDIITRFNATNVEQIGNKQLFIATVNNVTVLISYYTIVAYCLNDYWHYGDKKYTTTTIQQVNKFKAAHKSMTQSHTIFIDNLLELGIDKDIVKYC